MEYKILSIITLISVILMIYIRSKKMTIGIYVLAWYTLSLILSLFILENDVIFNFEATVVFLTTLIFFIYPIITFDENRIEFVNSININAFNIISYIFIILGGVTYVFFITSIYAILTSPIPIIGLRGDVAGGEVFYSTTPIYYLLTLYCQFYPIVLIFFFYSMAFTKNSKYFNFLLLFASTGYIVNVLSGLGRSGLVSWPTMFIFGYLIFRKFLNENDKKLTIKIFKSFLLIIITIFIIITMGRFAVTNDYFDGLLSVISYLGQQFGNFNKFYEVVTVKENNFFEIFPLIDLGKQKPSALDNYNNFLFLYGIDGNVFSTFIGDLHKNFNSFYLLLFSLFYGIAMKYILYTNGKYSLGKILILTLASQIPLTGLFFYDYSYVVSNIYFIAVFLMGIFFSKNVYIFRVSRMERKTL